MIFVLFAALSIIFFVVLKMINDFLSPSIIMIFVFLLSVLVVLFNVNQWGDISALTVFTILLSVLVFVIGCIISNSLFQDRDIKSYVQNYISHLRVNKTFTFCVVLFMAITTYFYYNHVYNLSLIAGNPGGISAMLSYARTMSPDDDGFVQLNSILNLSLIISQSFAYIYLYIYISNHQFRTRSKNDIIYLIPVFFYFFQSILTTGRVKVLNIIIFVLVTSLVFYKWRVKSNTKYTKKVKKVALTSLAIALIVFIVLDLSLRSSIYGTDWGIAYQLSKYIGSSIKALDIYLNNIPNISQPETMYNIHSILNRFGFEFNITSNALGSVRFGNVSTNVYTPIRRYINDYGFIGLITIQFLSGFCIQYFYNQISYRRRNDLGPLIYSYVVFFVFYSSFEERIFLSILSLNSVLTIILITMIWYFLVKKVNRGLIS